MCLVLIRLVVVCGPARAPTRRRSLLKTAARLRNVHRASLCLSHNQRSQAVSLTFAA